MVKAKTGVLLVNLGTPDSPSVADVRKYLREFLMDGRVIDIPFFSRWLLVNGIIAPFRAPKSAKVYAKLWTDRGSPLMFHGTDVRDKLQKLLGDEFEVVLGMRYQNPSIKSALEILKTVNVTSIIVIPLFPQYASATTGSVHEAVMKVISKWQNIPETQFISQYPDHPKMIRAFAKKGKKYLSEHSWDHVLFSYHGLPERQIHKASVDEYCRINYQCCSVYHSKNRFCYRAQCFQTSRKLADALGLKEGDYSVVFQSRLGKDPWIQPYAEDEIKRLAGEGKKSILVFCPSFVADCLETTIEVGEEFKEVFLEHGGEKWQLVESLNSEELWIDCLSEMVKKGTRSKEGARIE